MQPIALIPRDYFSGGRNLVEDPDSKRELGDLVIEIQTRCNDLAAGVGHVAQSVRVDGSRTDLYSADGSAAFPYKTINGALASFSDESAAKRYQVEVAPGVYTENVVLRRFISLVNPGGGFAAAGVVRLTSASGFTLSIPHQAAGIGSLQVRTTSANPADAAIRHFDDGGPWLGESSFAFLSYAVSTGLARAVRCDPNVPGEALIGAWFGADGATGGVGIECAGGSFFWFAGGGGGDALKQVHVHSGGAFLCNGGPIIGGGSAPAAWSVHIDGGMFLCLDGTLGGGANGLKLENGAMALLGRLSGFGGFAGTPVETAAGTFLILGDVRIGNPGDPPWLGWNVAGGSVIWSDGTEGVGVTAPVDQRPTGVPTGFKFFAQDLAAGGGLWLTRNGGAWVDPTGVIVP